MKLYLTSTGLENNQVSEYFKTILLPEKPENLSNHFAVNYISPTTGKVMPWEYIKDNKLIFQQGYDYDSTVRFDGYYLLDISTKKITFLQNDSNNYVKYDFFNDNNKNSFISVRPYEIYRITMN